MAYVRKGRRRTFGRVHSARRSSGTGFWHSVLFPVLSLLFGSLIIGVAAFKSSGSMSKNISSSGSTSLGQPLSWTNFKEPHTRVPQPTVEPPTTSDIELEIEEGREIALSLADCEDYMGFTKEESHGKCVNLKEGVRVVCLAENKVFIDQKVGMLMMMLSYYH